MSRDFWATLSDFCTELAPVSGPLLSVLGETAAAIDRANKPSARTLRSAAVPEPKRLSATKPRRSRSTSKRRRSSPTEVDYV